VESRKYRIMKQLNIHDRVQLTLHAIREGLVSLDDLV
jgi:DNA-binding NarL/FixJ family response regulator